MEREGKLLRSYALSQGAARSRACVVLAIVLGAASAHAAPPGDKAAAETLFQEARQHIARGEVEPGCKKLAASQKLDPAIGTLLNLGDCYDKLGRSASAWAHFREASDMARSAGDAEREGEAGRRASEIEPKLHRLRIVVSAPQPTGLLVTRDGVVVDVAVFGTAVPVDPGDHAIEASAPGMQKWRKTLWVSAPGQTLDVSIPQLMPQTSVAPGEVGPSNASHASDGSWHAQRWVALAVGGAGVVGLGLGTVYWLRGKSTWKDAQDRCPGNVCADPRDVSLEQDARRQASVATVGVTLGIAALGVGAALWFTAPFEGGQPTSVSAGKRGLSLRPWGTGLMVGGVY